MIRIVLLLLVATAVAVLVAYVMRPRRRAFHDKMVANRAREYAAALKAAADNPKLEGMPETELVDLLVAGANSIEEETNRKNAILGAMIVGTFFLAFVMATQEGMNGLLYVIGIAAVAGYGANIFWTRKIREPLTAMGLDPDRLASRP